MSGNNVNRRTQLRSVIRDGNDSIIFATDPPVGNLELANGVLFPGPGNFLPEQFNLVQILVVSSFDYFWKLETNLNVSGAPANWHAQTIYGAALAGIPVSLPKAICIPCFKDTQVRFMFDNGAGGMGGPIPWGSRYSNGIQARVHSRLWSFRG